MSHLSAGCLDSSVDSMLPIPVERCGCFHPQQGSNFSGLVTIRSGRLACVLCLDTCNIDITRIFHECSHFVSQVPWQRRRERNVHCFLPRPCGFCLAFPAQEEGPKPNKANADDEFLRAKPNAGPGNHKKTKHTKGRTAQSSYCIYIYTYYMYIRMYLYKDLYIYIYIPAYISSHSLFLAR